MSWAALEAFAPCARAQEPPPSGSPTYAFERAPARAPKRRRGKPAVLVAWQLGVPVGSTRDFVGDFTARGMRLDVRWFALENVALGASFGWILFDDKQRSTFATENGAFTSTQIRELQLIPLLATAHYVRRIPNTVVSLFGGLGIGAYYSERFVDAFVVSRGSDAWHFGLAPEIGALFSLGSVDLSVGVRYHWAAESEDQDAQFLGFDLGAMVY